ncbi:MAG TPA: metallopeptidase TldD-related protein [Gemmatimonadaceae bacterium]|jgi:predicted Zn-dependent protease|nr:metallopeptidase TldD-related protein [Gemmatimonadaceae bacterium]
MSPHSLTRRAPRSLFSSADESPALFTREQSLALAQKVQGYITALDETVAVSSSLAGTTEFALNDVQHGEDSSHHGVRFAAQFDKRRAGMDTDRLDDESLRAVVAKAEALAQALAVLAPVEEPEDSLRPVPSVNPVLWSDNSLALLAPEGRLTAIDTSVSAARKAGLVGAGSIASYPSTSAVLTKAGHFEYGRTSTCQYALTARTTDGTGSGWAAWEGEDWSKLNVNALTERAINLAQRSKNSVAIEPGRYTVVMTPDAVGELVQMIARVLSGREADRGLTPFSKPGGGNKIGMKVLDDRVSLSADPMDPDGGFLPFQFVAGQIVQFVPVTWIDHGVLKVLSYPTRAMAAVHDLDQVNNPSVLRMSGGPTSIDDMIASTTRGIYITRFSDVSLVSRKTLYMTGVTRDGTFLIEHGKITKPIKNLRFEDSPFFFLNNLEALGPARRVQRGNVMPPVMARDFAFTSLTDAV